MYLSLLPVMNHFNRLETLIINDVEPESVETILDSLFSLSVLSSLVIKSIGTKHVPWEIYQRIFRLPVLKYCRISMSIKRHPGLLLSSMNDVSSIEHLVIDNEISLNQLDSLLSFVPQLHRLSVNKLIDHYGNYNVLTNVFTLNYLINVSVHLIGIPFSDVEELVRKCFPQVQILHFSAIGTFFYPFDTGYGNAPRWQQFISTSMPNLLTFDFQCQNCSYGQAINRQVYENEISKFNTLFWLERRWFFGCQYYKRKNCYNALLCSINPYK